MTTESGLPTAWTVRSGESRCYLSGVVRIERFVGFGVGDADWDVMTEVRIEDFDCGGSPSAWCVNNDGAQFDFALILQDVQGVKCAQVIDVRQEVRIEDHRVSDLWGEARLVAAAGDNTEESRQARQSSRRDGAAPAFWVVA